MSSFDPANQIAERNLIFAGIALEKGLIETHHINHAFTIWVCDKRQHLGDILVEMKVLTAEQKQQIDQEVSQKLAQENVTVLSTMDCLEDLSSELNFLEDSNLKLTLGDAKKAKAEETPQVPESPPDPVSKQGSGSSSKQDSGSRSGPVPPETSGSDRFEPVDYLNSQGGMGELWRSRDKELNRFVVVKYIKRFRAQDPHLRGLFHLEGEVTGHLEHPNIPPVYSLGKDTLSRDYFAMRYFKGRKLTEEIRDYHGIPYHNHSERKEKLVELLQSFQTACLTVEFAHNRGIVHCDIKPDNIMVGEYGETLVIDWGLVVVKGAHQPIDHDAVTQTRYADNINYFNPSKSASSGLHVKQGGSRKSVGGTLAYMPPEQLQATENGDINLITFTSDVFGLGATLYHLLVGRAPYLPKTKEKETKSHFYERIRKGDFVPPRTVNPQIPKPLESIVKKAMACDPKQRYATPRELADDIRRWLSDEPTKAHREGVGTKLGRWLKKNRKTATVAGTLLLLSLLFGGFLVYREQQRTLDYAQNLKTIAENGFRIVEAFEPYITSDATMNPERKKILVDSAKAYQKILADFPVEEKTRLMAAKVFRYTANLHRYDYEADEAESLYGLSLGVYKKKLAETPDDKASAISQARTKIDYGQLLLALGKLDEARSLNEEARAELTKLFEGKNNEWELLKVNALIDLSLAGISHAKQDFANSEAEGRKVVESLRSIKKANQFTGYDPILLQSGLTLLGTVLREQKKLQESESAHLEAQELLLPFLKELMAFDQNIVRGIGKIDLLQNYSRLKLEQNLANLALKKDIEKIEPSLNSIVSQADFLAKANPSNPRLKLLQSTALAVRGNYFRKTGKEEKAKVDFQKSKDLAKELLDKYPTIGSIKTTHLRFLNEMETLN